MKKYIILLVQLLITSQLIYSQTSSAMEGWSTLLRDVKVRYIYADEIKGMISIPKFGKKITELEGKIITLQGFYLPVAQDSKSFVISYNPSSRCFFCSGAGIESIAELNARPGNEAKFRSLKSDNYIEVRGKLRLNADDYDHLIYILDDAVFLKLIRK